MHFLRRDHRDSLFIFHTCMFMVTRLGWIDFEGDGIAAPFDIVCVYIKLVGINRTTVCFHSLT